MICQDLKLHSIQVRGRLCPLILNNTTDVLTNKEVLVRNTKLKGSFGCSDHEMVVFKVNPWAVRKARSNLTTTLDYKRADLGLLRELPGRVL